MPVLRHVALLRGINVGGKNKLPMKDLAELFSAAGATQVSTYIQSGNVLFDAPPAQAKKIADTVGKKIVAIYGFASPIVLRTAAELDDIVRHNPHPTPEEDFGILLVMFLADRPSAARVATLDAARSAPDTHIVRGREIFLRCPTGFAKTKLTNAYFDGKLATVSTGRNWRTVLTLAELAR